MAATTPLNHSTTTTTTTTMTQLKRQSNPATRRVAYFLEEDLGGWSFDLTHPIKPIRCEFTNQLLSGYNLLSHPDLEIFRPQPATIQQMTMFHGDDYVDFLERSSPANAIANKALLHRYNLDDDSPVFCDMFEYCSLYTGASLGCAYRLNNKLCDVAINWSGGAKHAKKTHAHGGNYINDTVLSIMELLKYHKRVLYIDLGAAHADGVEEAFYHTNRVCTVDFHKYGGYFPGTGHLSDTGAEKGSHFSINVPLRAGLTTPQFIPLFNSIIDPVVAKYQPEVIVVAVGTDGSVGDDAGPILNLSSKAYLHAISRILALNRPLMILGGAGATITGAARIWTQITALCLDETLSEEIPFHELFEHYGPEYKLSLESTPLSYCTNLNTKADLESLMQVVHDNVEKMSNVPNITFATTVEQLTSRVLPGVITPQTKTELTACPSL